MKKTYWMLSIFFAAMCLAMRFDVTEGGTQVSWFWQDKPQVPMILSITSLIFLGLLIWSCVKGRRTHT